MQPHMPPLEEASDELTDQLELCGIQMAREENVEGTKLYQAAQSGQVDRETVRRCYRKNLEIVLGHVDRLLERLDCRVVVSADHGEYLGDRVPPLYRKRYGHGPINTHPRTAPLYRVPWFVRPGETRRDVQTDPPIMDRSENETPTAQLRALGYR